MFLLNKNFFLLFRKKTSVEVKFLPQVWTKHFVNVDLRKPSIEVLEVHENRRLAFLLPTLFKCFVRVYCSCL